MMETTPMKSRKRKSEPKPNTDMRSVGMETTPMRPKKLKLKIFISYAAEDINIANAVYRALTTVLGQDFAYVFLDNKSIESGLDFEDKIKKTLRETDILIIIYTGAEKLSHSYTGWEVGYFTNVMEANRSDSGTERRIVPLYLNEPPPTASSQQGIKFGLKSDTLYLELDQFNSNLIKDINQSHPMVKFLDNLKESVDEIRVKNGFEKSQSLDIVKCVRDMLTEIFSYLKTTIDKKLTPQRKIIIETNSQLQSLDDDLPSDAKLKPDGTGNPMQVFGLPSEEITWSQFISSVKDNKFGDSWRAAIVSVITSSLPNQIDVDNSQIIVSSDERHVYRLILTTSTTYYDKKREFHLYFVESPPRTDYGYRDTTLLLKGLGLVCRFRFMFLEEDSVFYSKNFLAQSLEKIPSLAREMIMELNLLLRDSREAGLDQPNVWSNFIVWETLLDMSEQWLPRERKIREIVARIRSNKNDQDLAQLRDELAAALGDMERTTRPYNRLLIEQMTDRLRGIVDSEEKSPNADPSRSKMGPHLVAPSSPTDSRDQK